MSNPLGMSDEEILNFNYDDTKISVKMRIKILNRSLEIKNSKENSNQLWR